MPLIACPDCERKISDRAKQCPDCMCPVAEVIAEQRAESERDATIPTRERTDRDVDCPNCEARGVYQCEDGYAEWCVPCEHTGRLVLCKASDGWYGVATYAVDRFLRGDLHHGTSGVVYFVSKTEPTSYRYPQPGERHPVEAEDIPWVLAEGESARGWGRK